MSLREEAAPTDQPQRLSPRLWVAAGIEIAVAVAVAAVLMQSDRPVPTEHHHGSSTMTHMHHSHHTQIHWHPVVILTAALTAAMLIWWLATRARLPGLLGAVGLVGLGTSEPVRGIALQSHLVAMAVLEALLVAVPLLLIVSIRRNRPTAVPQHSGAWTACVIIAVALNSALLIALHLPAVHGRGAHLDLVPLWLALLVVVVGFGYWGAILLTVGHVGPALRRGALVVGQEVPAILGLAALIRPATHMHHSNALGLSSATDQRLGGLLMLVTCAAVTLPLAKHIDSQRLRTEQDVY